MHRTEGEDYRAEGKDKDKDKDAVKIMKERRIEKNRLAELQTKVNVMTANKAMVEAEIKSLNTRIKFYEEMVDN